MKKLLLSLLCAVSSMTIYAVDGTLPGYFSVSETKTVAFSQGNLQLVAIPFHWRFADHQYDAIGMASGNTTDISARSSQKDSIDLFGWGTGNPSMAISASTDAAQYSTFTDWGTNAISNGGNQTNLWRTLTQDEWDYLFVGRTDAATKFGVAVINGIKGLIILPDEWKDPRPNAKSFTPSTTAESPMEWSDVFHYYSRSYYSFNDNSYTAEEWTVLETAGAVFLPCTAYRIGTACYDADWGCYWSSDPYSGGDARHLLFNGGEVEPNTSHKASNGMAVRLVREVAPQVGDRFKAASGEDTLQYEVTALAPNMTVRVTETGHILKEGTDLVIPATVKYIGQTFTVTEIAQGPQFSKAKTISLPNSLSKKVSWFRGDLSSLEAFIVEDDNPIFTVVGGVLYSKDKVTLYRCPAKKAFTSADFQPETKYLGNYAFYKNTAISDLVIPNTISYTELNTFYASSITSVFIPTSLKGLSNGEFGSCAQLASVTFENSALMSIAWDSFNNSKILNDQTDDIKVIDSVAIKYMGTADTVVFPDSIVNIAYACISYSREGSKTMTTVILPASIKALSYQFMSFNSASEKYPLLEKIICKAQDVPNIIGSGLQINSEKDVTLVVPCGKLSDYTTATIFSNPFTTIEEGFVYNVTLKQTEGGTIAYTKKEECNEIELTATPDEGYEFVKWNDDNTDATRTVAVNSDIELSATFQVKPTGFENVQRDNVQCTKVIRNGQLVFLCDGKVFNALGAEMK